MKAPEGHGCLKKKNTVISRHYLLEPAFYAPSGASSVLSFCGVAYAEVSARTCYALSVLFCVLFFFFSSRRRHTRLQGDWSSDVCSSDLFGHIRLGAFEHDFLAIAL